jgi:hypothetical protein
MKEHIELKKVIVAKLETCKNFPTANELYWEIRHEVPQITKRYEFKSFVKLINCFKEVEPVRVCKGKAMVYGLK